MTKAHSSKAGWCLAGLLLTGVWCTAGVEASSPDDAERGSRDDGAIYSAHEAAMLHTKLGDLLFLLGDLRAASRELLTAIRLSPDSPAPHNNMGMVLLAQGDSAGAVTEFSTAIRLCPDQATPWSNLGFALFERGELASAIEHWQTAVSMDSSLADAWAGLGLSLFASGSVDRALDSYRQAIRLDPLYADVESLEFTLRWSAGALRQAVAILQLIVRSPMNSDGNAGT